jgi:hypothetical protein
MDFSNAKETKFFHLSKQSFVNSHKNINFAPVMKILKAFILATIPFCLHAQKVEIMIQDNFVKLASEQTQSELKPGWTVLDIKLKDKLIHYLSGGHSSQLTDDNMPTFHIVPANNEVLVDYVVIRLQNKKYYRKLPKSDIWENDYKRVEPANFIIKSDGENGFIFHPLNAMVKGEYILLNIKQEPIGDLKDLKVYPFQVL